jgi:hypothetical protein
VLALLRVARVSSSVGALLCLVACTGSEAASEAAPGSVVQAIVDARTSGDCTGYEAHFFDHPALPRCDKPQPVVGPGPRLSDVKISNDTAIVEVADHYDCTNWDQEPAEYVDRYHLVRNAGTWKVNDVEFSEATSDDCFTY